MRLNEFLVKNKKQILAATEVKTRELAGAHPTSEDAKTGLPIFYTQLISIIGHAPQPSDPPARNIEAIAKAADQNDEPAMATAANQPEEAELAKSAGEHGVELRRLGYTLSHVVHAYGAMCQAITEAASLQKVPVSAADFHVLNRCLDVAIAGAVTEFQFDKDSTQSAPNRDTEMRNALTSATVAFQSIKSGVVGVSGSTGRVLEESLKKLVSLMDVNSV